MGHNYCAMLSSYILSLTKLKDSKWHLLILSSRIWLEPFLGMIKECYIFGVKECTCIQTFIHTFMHTYLHTQNTMIACKTSEKRCSEEKTRETYM